MGEVDGKEITSANIDELQENDPDIKVILDFKRKIEKPKWQDISIYGKSLGFNSFQE